MMQFDARRRIWTYFSPYSTNVFKLRPENNVTDETSDEAASRPRAGQGVSNFASQGSSVQKKT